MIDPVELVGYAGTALTVAAYAMKSSIRLRVAGIASSVAFLSYGFLTGSYPVMVMEAVLLPLNLFRLVEMLRLVRTVSGLRGAQHGLDWFVPHAKRWRLRPGNILVRQGEAASCVHLVLSGELEDDAGRTLSAGCLAGDAAPFGVARVQTRTWAARTPVEVASISVASLDELFFQNPVFGYRLAQLAFAGATQRAPAAV